MLNTASVKACHPLVQLVRALDRDGKVMVPRPHPTSAAAAFPHRT
jgi:hypothetical protein